MNTVLLFEGIIGPFSEHLLYGVFRALVITSTSIPRVSAWRGQVEALLLGVNEKLRTLNVNMSVENSQPVLFMYMNPIEDAPAP